MGMFLAPPLLATLKVLLLYIEKKMIDLDPWAEEEKVEPEEEKLLIAKVLDKVSDSAKSMYKNITNNEKNEE